MDNEKLYPTKCVKCDTEVTLNELKHNRAKVYVEHDNHFQPEEIWFEHSYDCIKLKKEYERNLQT